MIFLAQNPLTSCQFGIGVPQKLVKGAVERNHYKRQIQNSLILYLKSLGNSCQPKNNNSHSHYNTFIIVRAAYLKNNFTTNQKNLYQLLSLIHRSKTKFQ